MPTGGQQEKADNPELHRVPQSHTILRRTTKTIKDGPALSFAVTQLALWAHQSKSNLPKGFPAGRRKLHADATVSRVPCQRFRDALSTAYRCVSPFASEDTFAMFSRGVREPGQFPVR